MTLRFPYARPHVTAADVKAVTSSLDGQFLTQGPRLAELEAALAETLGARHAVVCNSGTAALHLVYLALKLDGGRGMLTSAVTFLATANAARMCSAPVAFADVDPTTGNVTPQTLRAALESATSPISAITVVHLGGRPCDMEAIHAVARERGVALVEDACHAPLAEYSDRDGRRFRVGACAHSDAAVFSFHPVKHVAMGEGGAVLTNDAQLAERARLLRNHGIVRDPALWRTAPEPDAPWYYEMQEIGWNYRASELQCALGSSQLRRLDESIRARRRLAARYDELLAGLSSVATPPVCAGHVWHLYQVAIDFNAVGKTRGEVVRELARRGIGTQVHYIPLYRQPYYAATGHRALSGAEIFYQRTLSLPMYVGLTGDDLAVIADAVRGTLQS